MSTSAPLVDCTCHMTGRGMACPIHGGWSIGTRDVAMMYFGCPAGAHEWLPWCRMDDGTFRTRCVHCSREETIGDAGASGATRGEVGQS